MAASPESAWHPWPLLTTGSGREGKPSWLLSLEPVSRPMSPTGGVPASTLVPIQLELTERASLKKPGPHQEAGAQPQTPQDNNLRTCCSPKPGCPGNSGGRNAKPWTGPSPSLSWTPTLDWTNPQSDGPSFYTGPLSIMTWSPSLSWTNPQSELNLNTELDYPIAWL